MSKSKSYRFDCFVIKPLHIRLWVACLSSFDDPEQAKQDIYRVEDKTSSVETPEFMFKLGALYQTDPKNGVFVLYCLNNLPARLIVHEVFHVINSLGYLRYLDPPNEYCDEAYAYLMEETTVQVVETLRKLGGTVSPL